MDNAMVNSVNQPAGRQYLVKPIFKQYKRTIIAVIVILSTASIYDNPQGFLNLWMTRDQQAAMFLKQGDPERAALTFEDKKWSAYSFYQAGNFEQALALFKQQSSEDALFAQANAQAHLGQLFNAKASYIKLLKSNREHQGAQVNLKLMEEMIKKLKKSSKKVVELVEDGKVDKNTQYTDAPKVKSEVPSDQLWLKQVQQNPGKFLRKKFQQEHVNASK